MPFVPVPKDLTKVKTKVAFNLTKRQLVCFGLGGLIGIPAYIFTRGSLGNETSALLMIGLMMPFFFFGIYEKDGQPLEKIIQHYAEAQFRRPRTRPYQTENMYASMFLQQDHYKEVAELENKTAGKAGKKPSGGKKPVKKG